MRGRTGLWPGRALALCVTLLAGSGFTGSIQAAPVFSYTVGQSLGPAFADAGADPPFGFPLAAGSYQAGTWGGPGGLSGPGGQPVAAGSFQAFVSVPYTGWVPITPLSGDTSTWAMTLNSQGHVIGNSTTLPTVWQWSWMKTWQNSPGTDHAFFFSTQGGTVALQTLNGNSGLPMGINNLDQIVGESYTSQGTIHGFITTPGGAAFDLNSLIQQGSGYTIVGGDAIDDQGRITAIAQGSDGKDYLLYLTPNVPLSSILGQSPPAPAPSGSTSPDSPPHVPEPGAIYLLGLAGASVAVRRILARRQIRSQA